jgi:glycogen debranching enzyme
MVPAHSSGLTSEAYAKALAKLKANTTDAGLLAAAPFSFEGEQKAYTALYSRDIGIASLGILAVEDEFLTGRLRQALVNVVSAQSRLGQIPFYYRPELNKRQFRTPGSVDSTLWWCIAVLLYYQKTGDHTFYQTYQQNLEKAFTWLTYQDTNNDCLLEQGEAADWADEMPRQGIVLYTNALWYWLLTLRVETENRQDLKRVKDAAHEGVNTVFWIHKEKDSNLSYLPDNTYTQSHVFARGLLEFTNSQVVYLPYYLSFVGHKTFELRCDTLGNILACLVGLADEKKTAQIIQHLVQSGCNLPYPITSLYPPIFPGEADWRPYMAKGRQNFPYQYHNGGIWPFIGGFWVQLLARTDPTLAKKELLRLAEANKLGDWQFNEYLHGLHGTPMGVPHQSWSMSMYLAAYKTLYP